jgi:hypothetical protein
MKNSVVYKGIMLALGSHSYELYKEKKFKELADHLKDQDLKDRKLSEDYACHVADAWNCKYCNIVSTCCLPDLPESKNDSKLPVVKPKECRSKHS